MSGARGWHRFAWHAGLAAWAEAARAAGLRALADPGLRARWLTCGGTWFVGVDALPTDATGAIGGAPLAGPVRAALQPLPPLHPAQLSVVWPGYPQPRDAESPAAFRYRRDRFAAHVDGITPHGPDRRRRVTEPHAWILGLPLNAADPDAAPLTVWEGSHVLIGDALRDALAGHARPADVDVTQPYQQARARAFETCRPRALHARPGEALLLHRHLLHGVAPWAAPPADAGRMIAYFRPLHPAGHAGWLRADDWPLDTLPLPAG